MSGHGVELIQSWFRKWLYKQNATDTFVPTGLTCPLAGYLKARGAKAPYVGSTHYIADSREYDGIEKLPDDVLRTAPDARKLPAWAAEFIAAYDIQRDHTTLGARQVLSMMQPGAVEEVPEFRATRRPQ